MGPCVHRTSPPQYSSDAAPDRLAPTAPFSSQRQGSSGDRLERDSHDGGKNFDLHPGEVISIHAARPGRHWLHDLHEHTLASPCSALVCSCGPCAHSALSESSSARWDSWRGNVAPATLQLDPRERSAVQPGEPGRGVLLQRPAGWPSRTRDGGPAASSEVLRGVRGALGTAGR